MTNKITLALLSAAGGAMLMSSPASAGQEAYLGEIFMMGTNFCPRGSAKADGQILSISQNTALFSLLGTMYGGDGRTTFALPDLRGRVAVHSGKGSGLDSRSTGQRTGAETQTLTTLNLPPHSHALQMSEDSVEAQGSEGQMGPAFNGEGANAGAVAAAGQTGSTGGGRPFSVLDPSLAISFCIATQGTFPSRN